MRIVMRPKLRLSTKTSFLLTVLFVCSFASHAVVGEEQPLEAKIGTLPTKPKLPDPAPATATPVVTGSVEGQVTYIGKAPPVLRLVGPGTLISGVLLRAGIPDESLLVDPKTDGIANVFVYLRKAPPGYVRVVPKASVPFAQRGFQFAPHAFTVQTGQAIAYSNRDPVGSSVHWLPDRNRGINRSAPAAPAGFSVSFPIEERTPIRVASDLESWMRAYMLIQDHPFMAVTDSNGNFSITGLPPGTHEFVVWHERGQTLVRKLPVTITAGKVTKLPLSYLATRF